MDNEVSLNEMWAVIEKYGIKRASLDPRNDFSYDIIHDLYLAIINDDSSNEGNKTKKQQYQQIR